MRNKNLLVFIGLLALIATLLTVWRLLSKPIKKAPSLPSPPPSSSFPSPLLSLSPISSPSQPSPTPEEEPGVKETKNKIIDNLPYETDGYSIQYLPNTDKFFILIKQNPYEVYKNEAIAWFKKFGVEDPEKDLPLFFTSTRWVAPE